MKNTLVLVVALSLAATAWSYADGTIQSANSWAGSRVVRYMPADLGADYRVWNKAIARTNSLGSVTYSTNQAYVELATGLNYQDAQGQWQESKAEFQLVPGWAVANTGRHKIGLAYNLNTKGSVAITMPDGHNMWGQVLALSYVDPATGQSVLLGEVKDCVGTLVASNQVLYADAFTDVKADVRYTYTKAGIEQDIVLREQLPDPSLIGMNPATTRLAVVTEFINPPSASVTEDAASSNSTDTNSLPDERINLGVMRFGEGRAFETGQQTVRRQRVGKKWATMNGRTFLFEEVPLSVIKASVNQLPKQASARPSAKVKSLAQMEIPSQRVAHTERRKMQMAKIEDEGTSSGFVLDYVLLNSSTYNYTFRGNTTYFVSGSVYIDGVTVEGGAVVKFDSDSLHIEDGINFMTTPYRPAVFTTKNDNSIGEPIDGSTGDPVNDYVYGGLVIEGYFSEDPVIKYARFLHFIVSPGIDVEGGSTITVKHCEFEDCSQAIYVPSTSYYPLPVSVQNCLFSGCGTAVYHNGYAQVIGVNLTIDNCSQVVDQSWPETYLTNCVLTDVSDVSAIAGTAYTVVTNASGVYQTAGAGNYYLANGSSYRDWGTTNIDPALVAEIAQMTTYPPTVYANTNFASSTTLIPHVERDTNSMDIGYHYAVLDYALSAATNSSTLTLTNGVVVGLFGTNGITMVGGASLESVGTPLAPNRLVHCQLVQEQSPAGVPGAMVWLSGTGTTVDLRSTVLGAVSPVYYVYGSYLPNNVSLRDCELYGGSVALSVYGGGTVSVRNNLFRRVNTEAYYAGNLDMDQNLFWGGSVAFQDWPSTYGVYDNAFDGTGLSNLGLLSGKHHNAFINTSGYSSTNNGNLTLSNFTYSAGALGDFYQSANSPLHNAGSTNAGVLGFYHYTTTTNQVKETNSVVDIGYHYVSLDTATGLPIDSDLDGIPDYLDPDSDGDSLPDDWEIHWFGNLDATASDDPDGDWLTNYEEYLAGSNPRDTMVLAWGGNEDGQCNVPTNLLDVVSVGGGWDYSVALKGNGTVASWGAVTNVLSNLTGGVRVASGPYHTLALKSDGTLDTWGDWWPSAYVFWPADVPSGLSNVVAVAAGADHDLALHSNGSITAWGYYIDAPYTDIPTSLPPVTAVVAGWEHSALLLQDQTVRAFGPNFEHVTNVPPGLTNVTALAAGDYHTLALKTDGTVEAWGAGETNGGFFLDHGQAIVPEGLSNVVAISAGGNHSLALKADGTVVVWGDLGAFPFEDAQGQIIAIGSGELHGLAIRTGRLTPLILTQPTDQFVPPGATAQFTAAGIGLAGVHYQWQFNGVNLSGETNALLTLSNVSSNEVGNYRALISTGAGSVMTTNATLTLLEAPTIDSVTPAPGSYTITSGISLFVTASANGTVQFPLQYQWFKGGTAIPDAGAASYGIAPTNATPLWQTNPVDGTYTVKVWNPAGTNEAGPWSIHYEPSFAAGTAVAWGANDEGQSEYPADLTNAISIAAGESHSVGVREDGSVVQWGYHWADVPGDLTNAMQVAAGYKHSLALRADGTVTAWGDAGAPNWVPTNLSGVKAVSAGEYHNVALLTNGTVVAWGTSLWGVTNVPANLTNVTAISAGTQHNLALKADGTVVAWGWNDVGQTNVPAGLSNVIAIAAGGMHSLALKSDGTVVGWGYGNDGQCTPPADLTNAMAIAAGWRHSVALREDGTVVGWGSDSDGQCDMPAALHNVKLIAAGGDHTLAAVFSPYLRYPGKAESLVDNMLHMLTSRTNATVSNAYFPLPPIDYIDAYNSWGTNLPVMQTNFWLRDATNVYSCSVAALEPIWYSATNENLAKYVCMAISPRHAVTAGHVGSFFQPGQKMVWFNLDGTYFTNTVVDYISEYEFPNHQDTDFEVILFAEDFPRFTKIMPSVSCSGNDLSFVCRRRVGTTFTVASSGIGGMATPGINFGDYTFPPGSTNYWFGWYGEDSSDPMWSIINNEAVLVGPAHSGGSATPLANYINMINADMELLSTNHGETNIYSVTLFNILR